MKISQRSEIGDVLDQAFCQEGPVLVEVIIDPDEQVLPMIPPDKTISDIILRG